MKTLDEAERQQRSEVARANREALLSVMAERGIMIPPKDFNRWRPTRRVQGAIVGIWDHVEILATNGILGFFLNGNAVVVGHVRHFSGRVETLYRWQRPRIRSSHLEKFPLEEETQPPTITPTRKQKNEIRNINHL